LQEIKGIYYKYLLQYFYNLGPEKGMEVCLVIYRIKYPAVDELSKLKFHILYDNLKQ